MSALRLRETNAREAGLLLELQRAASLVAFAHVFDPPFPNDIVLEAWSGFTGRVIVAERENQPVGFTAIGGEWIHALYVVPEEWGAGVGPELHDHAVAEIAHEHGEARLWVLEQNERARRFYERRGWRDNGDRQPVPFGSKPIEFGYSLDLTGKR